MKVYAPTWFDIKRNSSYIHGPKNLWSMIFRSRYLSDDLKAVIDPILQRNAFFAHQENILVAMLHDSRKHIRELALKRIMVARNQQEPSSDPREFKVPKLNFHARDYTDMIDFQDCPKHEPPLTKRLTVAELEAVVEDKSTSIISKRYPCHTQALERPVKLVTEASASVCREKERNGYIHSRILARKIMSTFETKSDFKCE